MSQIVLCNNGTDGKRTHNVAQYPHAVPRSQQHGISPDTVSSVLCQRAYLRLCACIQCHPGIAHHTRGLYKLLSSGRSRAARSAFSQDSLSWHKQPIAARSQHRAAQSGVDQKGTRACCITQSLAYRRCGALAAIRALHMRAYLSLTHTDPWAASSAFRRFGCLKINRSNGKA